MVGFFAAAAASWGVAMALAPLLQIQKIRRSQSSADVSLGYQQVLFIGFVLWLSYGLAAGNPAIIIPNAVSLLVCGMSIATTLRYR